jgi:hypothetical protein
MTLHLQNTSSIHAIDCLQAIVPDLSEFDDMEEAIERVKAELAAAKKRMLESSQVDCETRKTDAEAASSLRHYLQECNPGGVISQVELLSRQRTAEATLLEIEEMNRALRDGERKPPFILLDALPSIHDTVQLFKLCSEQEFPFRVLVKTLHEEDEAAREIRPKRPVQLLGSVFGGPGSGKSEIFKAFIWYAFQHGHSHRILVVSYTWKAAILVGEPKHNPGIASTTAFGVGKQLDPKQQKRCKTDNAKKSSSSSLSDQLLHKDLWFVLWDEHSFTNLSHFNDCSIAAQKKFARIDIGKAELPFGGLHLVTLQDFLQHQPVQGTAMYRTKQKSQPLTAAEELGRQLWLKFKVVWILKEQHRFTANTADGKKIYDVVKAISSDKGISEQEIEEICDMLNEQVIKADEFKEMLKLNPKVSQFQNESNLVACSSLNPTHRSYPCVKK